MIFMALFATVEPGDETIIPAPYWGSYIDIAQMLGATPVVIATRPEDGFRLRAEDLEDAITPRTRWLLINSPSNPQAPCTSTSTTPPCWTSWPAIRRSG